MILMLMGIFMDPESKYLIVSKHTPIFRNVNVLSVPDTCAFLREEVNRVNRAVVNEVSSTK